MKNQEGQSCLDLASADDVKSLLQDAMVGCQPLPSTSNTAYSNACITPTVETVTLPSGATMNLTIALPLAASRSCLSPIQGAEAGAENLDDDRSMTEVEYSVASFLSKLKLDHLNDLFEREQITLEILVEMGHEDLKQIGVTAFGFRHKILKANVALKASTGKSFIFVTRKTTQIFDYFLGFGINANPGTLLIDLLPHDKEFLTVEEEMQATIREHARDSGQSGGYFGHYNIVRVNSNYFYCFNVLLKLCDFLLDSKDSK